MLIALRIPESRALESGTVLPAATLLTYPSMLTIQAAGSRLRLALIRTAAALHLKG